MASRKYDIWLEKQAMEQLNSKVRFKTVAKLILPKEFSKGWEMSECFEGSEKAS